MNTPRQPPSALLWPLLAVGIAGSGSACSAPTPPPPQTTPEAAPAQEPVRDAVPVTTPAPPSPADTMPGKQPPSDRGDAAPAESPPPATTPPPTARPAPAARQPPLPADAGTDTPATLTVTMLSRGKGVPDEARAAYKDARDLLERQRDAGAVDAMQSQRIGLEGETRLCAEFGSEREARAAYAEIKQRIAGIDLIDADLAPCPPPKGKTP